MCAPPAMARERPGNPRPATPAAALGAFELSAEHAVAKAACAVPTPSKFEFRQGCRPDRACAFPAVETPERRARPRAICTSLLKSCRILFLTAVVKTFTPLFPLP